MNYEPRHDSLMRLAGAAESDLPGWLKDMVRCFRVASKALDAGPDERKAGLLPALAGSDAVISAHMQRLFSGRLPDPGIDRMKMLRLKAGAVRRLMDGTR